MQRERDERVSLFFIIDDTRNSLHQVGGIFSSNSERNLIVEDTPNNSKDPQNGFALTQLQLVHMKETQERAV